MAGPNQVRYEWYDFTEQLVSLPQPKMKKKTFLFSLLPNTVTNIMYNITPSHNIQKNADMNKYCNNAATSLQAP